MAIFIATGVPKTAAALFQTTLVKSAINNFKTLRMTGIEKEAVKSTNQFAMKSEPPVISRAVPRLKLATISMMTGIFIEFPTSLHLKAPASNITKSPIMAATEIGMMLVAAIKVTPNII